MFSKVLTFNVINFQNNENNDKLFLSDLKSLATEMRCERYLLCFTVLLVGPPS